MSNLLDFGTYQPLSANCPGFDKERKTNLICKLTDDRMSPIEWQYEILRYLFEHNYNCWLDEEAARKEENNG
jgi:endonuclease I